MNAKEAYELAKRSDALKLKRKTMQEFDSIIKRIEESAKYGYTNVVFMYNPFTDYDYIVGEFKKLGYKAELNVDGIRIDWSEPK